MSQERFVIFPPDKCHLFFSLFYLLPRFESGSRLEKADLHYKERTVSPWLEEKAQKLSPGSVFIQMLSGDRKKQPLALRFWWPEAAPTKLGILGH